jgi:PIN domain nuclease of toxin-antitoxin system
VILLLDTHVLLWSLSEPETLDADARRAIEDPANEVLVSAGSIWEIEIKRALGKLRHEVDVLAEIEGSQFDSLPITGADAVAAAHLPFHHRDPFDRMLVAQAQRLDATIVSRDGALDAYGVHRLPA